jgi:hypothetical protein
VNTSKTLGFLATIVGITFFLMTTLIHLKVEIGVLSFNPNLETPYFLLGIVSVLFAISGFWLNHNESGKVPRIQRKVYEKCYNCDKELLPSIEQVELTKNI